MNITFNNLNCPACRSVDLAFSAGKRNFTLLKCAKCGLVRTEPMPTDAELFRFYQGFAFEEPQPEDIVHDLSAIESSLRHFIGTPNSGANSFLDYGGGFGIYCRAARNLGWEPSLFDYDRGCLGYARNEMGVENVASDLTEFRTRKFDVIWGFHVIEHWNRIDDNMQALLDLLAPGGRIIFATPHADSVEKWVRPYHSRNYVRSLIFKGESVGRALKYTLQRMSFLCWDPPRHLYAFSEESLHAIGRRYGLEVCVETGYNTSLIHDPRQYVVPNPFAPRFKVPMGASVLTSLARRITACFSYVGCKVLSILFPKWGEQIYVSYTRSSSNGMV